MEASETQTDVSQTDFIMEENIGSQVFADILHILADDEEPQVEKIINGLINSPNPDGEEAKEDDVIYHPPLETKDIPTSELERLVLVSEHRLHENLSFLKKVLPSKEDNSRFGKTVVRISPKHDIANNNKENKSEDADSIQTDDKGKSSSNTPPPTKRGRIHSSLSPEKAIDK